MEGVTYMRDTWGETKRLDERGGDGGGGQNGVRQKHLDEREPRERRRLDDCREREEPLAIEGAHLADTQR